MEEPIIYHHPAPRETMPIHPPKMMYNKLFSALCLDDKDEFLGLLKDPEFDSVQFLSKHRFLSKFDVIKILEKNTLQIGMALINGETKGIIDDPLLVFKDGWTPLHLATATTSTKLIKCLIERGDPLDIPCDYAPLDLKQATPLDLALEVIDTGYIYGLHLMNKPWTLHCSIFDLLHYVCQWKKPCLEVIRLLVQNTQNKERVRKAFLDSANEGKLIKLVALFLASPELFLSTFLEGGSMSSIDALYLNLNSLDKKTDIQRGLSSLLDVFDLVGHMLIAYIRLNDPKVWDLSDHKKTGFFLREAAHIKLGISSYDDYLLSLFKPMSQPDLEAPCISPKPMSQHAFGPLCMSSKKSSEKVGIDKLWHILPFIMKREDIDIDYFNRMIPSLEPHEADDLRKAIDNKLSIMPIMPNICIRSEGTTRMPNKGGKQSYFFPLPKCSVELPRARSFCTEAPNVNRRLDLKLIPKNGWDSRVMNPTKLESFVSIVRLSRFPMIVKRLIK